MKRVAAALNEQQYKIFHNKATQLGVTDYALTKQLIDSFLETGTIDKAVIKLMAQAALKYTIESLKESKEIFDGEHIP